MSLQCSEKKWTSSEHHGIKNIFRIISRKKPMIYYRTVALEIGVFDATFWNLFGKKVEYVAL